MSDRPAGRVLAAVTAAVAAAGTALAGCSGAPAPGGAGHVARAGAATASAVPGAAPGAGTTDPGGSLTAVTVSGAVGARPTLAPPGGPAPTAAASRVVVAGTGTPVSAGRLVVARQFAQSWPVAGSPPVVVGDSFVTLPTGTGQLAPGLEEALAGRRVGSRVLVTLPGVTSGGGTAAAPTVMVLDVLAVLPADAAAHGRVLHRTAPGLPTLARPGAARPRVATVGAAAAGGRALSGLVVAGAGARVTPGRQLVVRVREFDPRTGKALHRNGSAPYVTPSGAVTGLAGALAGARVGSRAVAVVPRTGDGPARILVVDLLAQF